MFAVRRQHIADVIEPALLRGAWVVCDRITDATVAYQGGGRGLPLEKIDVLRAWVHPRLEPCLTVLFDLPPEVAKQRLDATRDKDRFESEARDFFVRVRAAYLRIAAAEPDRVRIVDGSKTISAIRKELEELISSICAE